MTVHPAAVAVVGVIVAGLLSLVGVLLGHQASRIDALERRVDLSDVRYRALWGWARRQLDLYYRWRRPNAPDPDPIPDLED